MVFHKSDKVYGSQLNGELISQLSWSPSSRFIAASMENTINIWHLPGKNGFHCVIYFNIIINYFCLLNY